ncbi:MAG: metal-dependent hydrolase [Pseudomonadales bacterium]|nr:metal-dependent hydrolase [Pseudomonadales bacterium]
MSDLKVRKIDFQFPDDIAFQWNPGNPYWGNFVNYATVIAPAFERYFIKATRAAMGRISSPAVALDADLFCQQEAQHSKHHLAHLAMLSRKYPELEQVRRDVLSSYEHLFEKESEDFHLAYSAVIELCFGPLAKFVVENRDSLFVDADSRIASFILWHLVEEFEHRNAAIDIYNDVVGSYWYRLKSAPKVIYHIFTIDKIVRQGFKDHVPHEPGKVGPSESILCISKTPLIQQLKLLYELCCTFLPYHNPNNIQQPEWVTQWFKDEAAGVDMRAYYSN